MNNLNNFIPHEVLKASWTHSTSGIVAIDTHGKVMVANPAFVHCTGIEVSTVIGMSEADFNALLNSKMLESRRTQVVVDDLRAIYQMRCNCCSTQYNSSNPKLSHVAEMLREPLASIYGFTELLLTQNYDEDTRIALTSALFEQVEVMSNLINTQLDLHNIKRDAQL